MVSFSEWKSKFNFIYIYGINCTAYYSIRCSPVLEDVPIYILPGIDVRLTISYGDIVNALKHFQPDNRIFFTIYDIGKKDFFQIIRHRNQSLSDCRKFLEKNSVKNYKQIIYREKHD